MEEELQGSILIFLVSCLLSSIIVRSIFFAKTRTKARLPPSPLALPIIGHLHLLGRLPHQALHELSNRYGPLIHLSLGCVPCVVASSSEVAKEFLKTHGTSFLDRPKPSVLDYISYPPDHFTFSEFRPYWKFIKTIFVTRLLGGQSLDHLHPIRREELKSFLDLMTRKSMAKEAVDVGTELAKLTNNIVSRMVLSRRCTENDEEAEEIRMVVSETTELVGKFNLSRLIWFCKKLDLQGLTKKGKEIHEKFDKIVEKSIEEHREARRDTNNGSAVKDFLTVLLEISDDESSEIRLTRDNIKALILEIFIAGTDTAAITLEWALAELINHPNIMNKAREEIDFVIGKTRLVEESDIANLPYIQAIVKETMRLHPAAPLIVRESSQSCTINGYDIPERTRLFVNVWAIGRDPKCWEDPLEFKPERFLSEEGSGKSQLDVRGQNFLLLPFGSGKRACPGISLALQIVQTSLAAMIQCFEWKIDGKDGDVKVDMEEGPGITLPRAHPLMCVPTPRLSPLPI